MASNRFKLNPVKSEFFWRITSRRLHLIERSAFHLLDGDVIPGSSVRNLGAYFDEGMVMFTHENQLVSSSFYQLQRIWAIQQTIMTSIVTSSPLWVLCTPHRDTRCVVSYGPAPLMRLLDLDTERIIVSFFSKGVNHTAYLAHVSSVAWWVFQFSSTRHT